MGHGGCVTMVFHAWCPGDEAPEDGRSFTDEQAESPEIAAARYALLFAKNWLDEPRDLAIAIRSEDGHERQVRVRVEPHPSGVWGWRVALVEAVARDEGEARPS